METETIPAVRSSVVRALSMRILGRPALFAATLAVTVLFLVPRSMADPDIWWHLRNAEVLMASHRFIGADRYSFTAFGAPWINHEWLGELPFYFGWRIRGERGLYGVTLAAIELIMAGVFLLAWRRSRSLVASLGATVTAAVLSTVTYGPRTVLFGWLMLVIELLILDRTERRPGLVWALPPLFALWVNTHGSWMIGLVVLGMYVVLNVRRFRAGALWCDGFSQRRLRAFALAAAGSVGGLFVNPYGWRLVAYPLNLAFQQRLNVANVQEWRSLDLHSPRGVILLGCLGVLVLAQIVRGLRWRMHEVAFLFLGVYAGLTYTRFLVLFSILAAPMVACSVAFDRREERVERPMVHAAFLFLLACLVAGRFRERVPERGKADAGYPEGAIGYLRGSPPRGRVFNEYLWGGYMVWHLREVPVFIDSRVDLFEYNGTFRDYLDIVRVKNSLDLLKKYDIRYVFFEKDTPLVYLLEHTGGWTVDYEAENVILLERLR